MRNAKRPRQRESFLEREERAHPREEGRDLAAEHPDKADALQRLLPTYLKSVNAETPRPSPRKRAGKGKNKKKQQQARIANSRRCRRRKEAIVGPL